MTSSIKLLQTGSFSKRNDQFIQDITSPWRTRPVEGMVDWEEDATGFEGQAIRTSYSLESAITDSCYITSHVLRGAGEKVLQ